MPVGPRVAPDGVFQLIVAGSRSGAGQTASGGTHDSSALGSLVRISRYCESTCPSIFP